MRLFFEEDVNELFYGGAAGGGKSELARALAHTLAVLWPGARIAIFRENYTQLEKTHIPRYRIKMKELGFNIDDPKVWAGTAKEFRYPNGSVVEFLHVDKQLGAEKWLSAEWAALILDEATQIPADDISVLFSRVRANEDQQRLWTTTINGRKFPWRPVALYCSNPGGQSHDFFKERFVEPAIAHGTGDVDHGVFWDVTETVELFDEEMELSVRRAFLPAFLSDNPSLNAGQYAAQLHNIGGVRAQQMLEGNWDSFEGKVFDMLIPSIHLVDARDVFAGQLNPPTSWMRAFGLDHGTANPTAAEWTCIEEDGFYVTYMEYYSPGSVGEHVDAIRALMVRDGVLDLIGEADPRMWHRTQGMRNPHSIADEYAWLGEPPTTRDEMELRSRNGIGLRSSRAERVPGMLQLARLLTPDQNVQFPAWHPRRGQYGSPRLFIARQCPNLWRELNGMQYAEGKDEPAKRDDHAFDAEYRALFAIEQRNVRRAHSGRGPRRVLEASGAVA